MSLADEILAQDQGLQTPTVSSAGNLSLADQIIQEEEALISGQETGFLEAAGQTARTLLQAPLTEAGAGWAGIVELAMTQDPQKATQAIEQFRNDFSFTPTDERSQAQLQDIGNVIQKVDEITKPVVGQAAGLGEIFAGGTADEARRTEQMVQDQGFSKTLGDRILEETGNPLFATIAEASPQAALSVSGLRAAGPALGKIPKQINPDVLDIPKFATRQSSTNRELARILQENPYDPRTATLELVTDQTGKVPFVPESAAKQLQEFFFFEEPRVKNSKAAIDVINDGFTPKFATIGKAASPREKIKLSQMVDNVEQKLKNPVEGPRASDVVGDSLIERYKFVDSVRQGAGDDLEIAVKGLENKPIDITEASNNFSNSLDRMGVKSSISNGKVKLDFEDSIIGGDLPQLKQAQKAIENVVGTMVKSSNNPTAKNAHDFKKKLDELLFVSNTPDGLRGTALRAVEDLRRDINQSVRNISDEYAEANDVYSAAATALEDTRKAFGQNFDFGSESAATSAGTKLKSLLSNNAKRGDYLNAINSLEDVSIKNGADFDDNILRQVHFYEELEQAFPDIVPQASLKGNMMQVAKMGGKVLKGDLKGVAKTIGETIEGGIDPNNQFEALEKIRTLLSR